MKPADILSKISYFRLIESSIIPVYWFSADSAFFYANKAVCDYLGYTCEELFDLNFRDIDINYNQDSFDKMISELKERRVQRFETVHKRKDGTLAEVEVIRNYLSEGGTELVVSFVFDITDKKRNERQFSLISSLIELSKDNIFVIDTKNMCIAYANEQACASSGHGKDEIKGLHVSKIRKPAEDGITFAQYVEQLRKVRKTTSLGVVVRKDGSVLDVETSLSLINFGDDEYVVAIARDITERLAKEKELRELNALLEQKVYERTRELEVHKARLEERVEEETAIRRRQESIIFAQQKFVDMSRMLNAIAHHWLQPVNAIGLIAQDIQDTYNEGSSDSGYMNDSCGKIMMLVEEMSNTLDQFRVFFRTEDEVGDFEIVSTVSDFVNLIKIQMNGQNIEMNLSISTEISAGKVYLNGPHIRLKQAVMSIIDNAAESISSAIAEGTLDKGRIEIFIISAPDSVIIRINDNGGGVDSALLDKIFEPYYTTKKDPKSTGLGLFMCKTFIEKNFSGSLTAKNAGDGFQIDIKLPLKNRPST